MTPPVNINNLIVSGTVKRSMSDKMYSATFKFDKNTTAGPTSSIYWQPLSFWMPDYSGTWNLIFYGIAPSSQSNYAAYGGDDTLTAYDYAYYLVKQYLDDDMTSMPWDPGTETMNPDTFVNICLGYTPVFVGTQWNSTAYTPYATGINAYRINTVPNWNGSLTAVPFAFTPKTTKYDAIVQLCQYCQEIFYCRWMLIGGVWTTIAYFIPYTDIDSVTEGLGLPAMVYVTKGATRAAYPADGGGYLIPPVTLDQKGEDACTNFKVRCQTISGAWIQQYYCENDHYDRIWNPTGTKIKRDYYEENQSINNATDAFNRALLLASYYYQQVTTWKCKFQLRSDLVLFQKLYFSGWGAGNIPDGTYRIIEISYTYADGGATNEVSVSVINDSQFVAYLAINRLLTNNVYETKNIVTDTLSKQKKTLTAYVVRISYYQPMLTFVVNGLNYVVTGDIYGSGPYTTPPPYNIADSATITGISGTTITFTISGNSYTGTCAQVSNINIGNNGAVTSINALINFKSTDLGTGRSLMQVGYSTNAKKLSTISTYSAIPDQNGKYCINP